MRIALLLFIAVHCQAQVMKEHFMNAPAVQLSKAYSHGVVLDAGGTRFMTSGIIGTNEAGALASDPREQIRQTFDNIRAILATVGADVNDILEIETFLVDTATFMDYALERRDFFNGRSTPPPVSKTYYAKRLVNPRAIVEVAVMAHVKKAVNRETVFVTAIVIAKPGKAGELREALTRNILPSRSEPGCIVYELHQSQDNTNIFTLHEQWTNREALNLHFQKPYMKELAARGRHLIKRSEVVVVNRIEP